jgi:predicted Zn-dependent protease
LAGTVGALAWGAAAVGLLVGVVWPDMAGLVWQSACLAVAVTLYVSMQVILAFKRRRRRLRLADAARDEQFKAVLAAYLQGRYDEAEAKCRALLHQDPDDVEAALQLGTIARRRGKLAVARRWFRRARYLDDRGKWDFEIDRGLASLVPPAGRSTNVRSAPRG